MSDSQSNQSSNSIGTEVIIHSLPIILSYLEPEDKPNIDFLLSQKRLYNHYRSKQRMEIKETYEKLKKATPMKCKRGESLVELGDIFMLCSNKRIVVPFLIPNKEMDYYNELTEKDMLLHYRRQYLKKPKNDKENHIIALMLNGNLWTKTLHPFLCKLKLQNTKLNKYIDFVNSNYWNLKAELLLKNYEVFLNKKTILC